LPNVVTIGTCAIIGCAIICWGIICWGIIGCAIIGCAIIGCAIAVAICTPLLVDAIAPAGECPAFTVIELYPPAEIQS
jgi:hypothetical protein